MVFTTTSQAPLRSTHLPYPISIAIPKQAGYPTSLTSVTISRQINPSNRGTKLLLAQTADLGVWSSILLKSGEVEDDAHLCTVPSRSNKQKQSLKIRWDSEVQQMASGQGMTVKPSSDSKGTETWREKALTRCRVIDARWAWLSMFSVLRILHG